MGEPSGRGDDITISIVNREGRVASVGRAGLGTELGPQGAWDPGAGSASAARGHGEIELSVAPEQVRPMLEVAGDRSEWFRTQSPWGRPVVPPEHLMGVALGMSREQLQWDDDVLGPLIWAEHSLVSRRPLLLDEPYRMTSSFASAGRSSRTVFVQTEFAVRAADGAELVRGRQKVRSFVAGASTGPSGKTQHL